MKTAIQLVEQIERTRRVFLKQRDDEFKELLEAFNVKTLELEDTYEQDKRDIICMRSIKTINGVSLLASTPYDLEEEVNYAHIEKAFYILSQAQEDLDIERLVKNIDFVNKEKLDLDKMNDSEIQLGLLSLSLNCHPKALMDFLIFLANDTSFSSVPSKYIKETI
jgi:hypothetical protein